MRNSSTGWLSQFRGAVFDLDGTLLDTLSDIGNAANAVLAHHGFPLHPIEQYRHFVGDGVRVLMTRALPDNAQDAETVAKCLQTMEIEYRRHLNKTAQPYPGIFDLLHQLKSLGLRLAVLSNKADAYTRPCVVEFFGDKMFEPIFGLRPDRPRKPDPAGALEIAALWQIPSHEVLYFGDSGTDMLTANSAGMLSIGVSWGYRSQEELQAAGAKYLLAKPSDLFSLNVR